MIRNRKQEIARCRRGLGASLLLAASSLPALGTQTVDDLNPLDRTKDITIAGQQSGTAVVPDIAPDLVKKLYPLMGGGAVSFAPFALNPVNGAVTITDNLASGSIALSDALSILGVTPPAWLTLDGSVSAGLGGGLASIQGVDLAADKDVAMSGNRAVAAESGPVTAEVDLDGASGGTVTGTLKVESSASLAGGGALAAIMGPAAIASADGAVNLSGNSAAASGGIAAALGGGALSVTGDVDIDGKTGVVAAGNSAAAHVSAPLNLKVGAVALPGAKKILDGVSLEGSLALAGGGAAFSGGAAYVNGNDDAAALSDNSAAASGALALAAGGLAAAREIEIAGKSAVLKGNSASAASDGNVELTVEGLDLGDVIDPTFPELKLQKGALRLPLAAAVGSAGASVSYIDVTADETVELSGNAAAASGGIAAALGGGLTGFGGVYLTGPKGVSVTGNAAQATAQNFELLGLEGVSVVYDDDANLATPNYRQSLDSLSLQGSLAAALGGGVLGVGTELDAKDETLALSRNSASASGGIAAAAGGGFADFGGAKLAGKTVEMTDNAVSATAEGGLSLEVKGLALDLG